MKAVENILRKKNENLSLSTKQKTIIIKGNVFSRVRRLRDGQS